MKRFKIKYLVGSLLVFVLASCSKELEKFPYSDIELSQSFKTVKDAKTWNAGLYSNLRGRINGIYTYTTDVQADQLNASLDFGNRNGFPHRWDGFLADDYSIRDIWQGYYRGITNVNIAINGFGQITPASSAEEKELNRYKGDAYLARAFYYHQLIQLFAKPYEPASASSDLGVPLVLEYNINAQPARATVKAVYDQILSDLAQAKSLLSGVAGAQGSTRFTKDVITALEARVKLNMQDWTGAKVAADALINSGTYPLITSQSEYTSYWQTDGKKESILQLFVSAPSELANANSIYLGFVPATGRFTPDFIPSQWVVDKYNTTDIRKAAYFAQKPVTVQGSNYNDVWLVNKYPGHAPLFTGANTNYQHAPKVFRIAEMYLISAEAGARSGNAAAEADALLKLNALRTARGLTLLSGLTGTDLFNAVKEERFLELAFEGFRLLDLKRWHEGFTRHDPQSTNMLSTGTGYVSLSIPANHNKFVWGLPANDVSINKNLQQNTDW
jgi:starch-binding outer membrane protein, SusD/RagB family